MFAENLRKENCVEFVAESKKTLEREAEMGEAVVIQLFENKKDKKKNKGKDRD